MEFSHRVLTPNLVSKKEKLVVAVAISHITDNAYSIEHFTRLAKQEGVTIEEVTETILVAAALKAGSALAHRINTYNAFVREDN
nr:carboxymuconolactone decarboxylase family protein [Paenibacillus psychroresistens]